jgi:hypothetical protein
MLSKRFGAAGAVAVLSLASASVAVGQDTVPPAQPVPQQSGKHVVQAGETLWSIARLYMGDPFLWPEIYRLNTGIVEDPHWIFPGEELLLAPGDQTAVTAPEPVAPPTPEQPVTPPPGQPPAAPPPVQQPQAEQRPVEQPPPPVLELPVEAPPAAPPPPVSEGATVFARYQRASEGPRLSLGAASEYRALRAGDFYGAGFLTEEREFPWAEVLGTTDPAGERAMVNRIALYRQVIQIRAPAGANYQVGDSLVTYRLLREVGGGWGQIAQPTAIVRVVHVAGRDVLGDVVTEYDQVRAGQLALPAEPFPDPGSARPQPVADGVLGGIVTLRALREVPKQYDVLFIDLGRNAGITPGDVLEVLPRPEDIEVADRPAEAIALLQVVHVTERSATVLITGIFTPGIRVTVQHASGAPVRLIRKMPS